MGGQGLELVFTSAAVLGAGLLILSSLGTPMRLRVHLPVRFPRTHLRGSRSDNATATPVVLGFVALFGIGGLLAVALTLAPIAQVLLALAFGTFGGTVAFAMFAALRRAEGRQPTALRDLIGRRARVTVTIAAGARGAVSLLYDGAVQNLPATASHDVARGVEVEVIDVRGLAIVVRSIPPP